MKTTTIVLFFLCIASYVTAQNFTGINKLVERQFPFLKDKVIFAAYKTTGNHVDSASLHTAGGKLYVTAATPVAAAYAVNQFVQLYCRMSISHVGDNIKLLHTIPSIKDTSFATQFQYRYALNYCTYSYTFSFYDWKDWEKELDWMALNGVNLLLAPMGTEIIWAKVLKSIGYNDQEIKAFIPGPAFNAWWLMGNLEGWGGPVTDNIINRWAALQQQILQRMKALGIQPVVQSFWGMVPDNLSKKFPTAKIVQQGLWAGGFQRPAFLSPQDSLFAKMADVYYTEMQKLYGKDIHFFGGDLFHEGGIPGDLNVKETATGVQAFMQKYYPGSTWVLQGWQGNPRKDLLEGLKKENVLVVDLMGEMADNWEKRDAYGHTPWVWCSINNWGGRTGMGAMLQRILDEPHRAAETPQGAYMRGIGIIPEGINNNPIVYASALQTAWTNNNPDQDLLLRQYILSRYGNWNEDLYKAWKLLMQSLYGNYSELQKGATEAVFCARPRMNVTNVSSWGPGDIQYDPEQPEQALLYLYKAAGDFKSVPTYQFDLVDLARQVIDNRGRAAYKKCMEAYNAKNITEYKKQRDLFMSLLQLQENLLSKHSAFMLGTWLQQARRLGKTPAEQDLYEQNARTQITYWGADNAHTNLHEYAHKEWAGLLTDFYMPRWRKFFDALDKNESKDVVDKIDYFNIEKEWANSHNTYPVKPSGDCIEQVRKVLQILGL